MTLNYLLFAAGLVVVSVTMLDALRTTVASGGGPLTSLVSRLLWQAFAAAHRRGAGRRLLTVAGPLILLTAVALWIVSLWAGYVLLFSADASAVVTSQTGAPANVWGRVYFAGYTLFTLGIGNYVPQGSFWEVLTALASINGLFLVTLSITYLIPVLSAAVAKRQFGALISDLGATPQQVLEASWNGRDFKGLESYLAQLIPLLELHTYRHLAYPVLHYFHSAERHAAVGISVAVLDEALLVLAEGVPAALRPAPALLVPARRAIGNFLETLSETYVEASERAPAGPDLEMLRCLGVQVEEPDVFADRVRAEDGRRRLLEALVLDGGWTWEAVTGSTADGTAEADQEASATC